MPARQPLAYAGLLLACLFWAGNALVARAFFEDIPPLALSFWRWFLALSILLVFVGRDMWHHRSALRRAGWRLWVIAALGIASYNSLLYSAAQTTPAINISLVNTCLPLATFIGGGLLLGEWPRRRAWVGLAIAAVGLLLLISRGEWANLAGLQFTPGDLVMLVAVVVWALYTLLLRRWGSYLTVPPLVLLTALVTLGTPLILPFYLWELSQVGGFEPSLSNLAAIFYTALFASLIAYLAWNNGVKVVGAAKAAITSYSMPVFVAILGWLLLGEALQPYHWVGGGLIFGGLLLATLQRPA
ncbi:DMT family transporter [Stutzerimonas urumqiensis]|uniref:DMT family transporter n=1 Tax=Stutzerimonas urumqiensis TaxID=638269 RepID=UPI000EAEE24F|nr:DMT family transporter [Stutzerimonas urumqiensis]